MRTTIDPPLHTWSPTPTADADRQQIVAASRSADGATPPPTLRSDQPVIATGHQAQLWHPGILAKYIALRTAADKHDAAVLNVIVDHDVYDPLRLDLPLVEASRLSVRTVQLASTRPAVPPRMQPPVEPQAVLDTIGRLEREHADTLAADLSLLADAWRDLPDTAHLADQMAVVLARLAEPFAGNVPFIHATELMSLEPARSFVDRMLADARSCVRAYNRALAVAPEAGMRPLHDGVDLVELPLWAVHANGRAPIFAMMNGHAGVRMTCDIGLVEGCVADGSVVLAPRALTLTAVMRQFACDLFIHGKGGGVYDRITEAWIDDWLGRELAPMAVVSADVYRDFDVPTAEPSDVDRAVWWAHHLPHNVDRALSLDGPLVDEKRDLLATMDVDRDGPRRAAAFRRLHAINRHFAADHRAEIDAAAAARDRARAGLHNRDIAARRDWCVALYPPEQLAALVDAVNAQITVPAGDRAGD